MAQWSALPVHPYTTLPGIDQETRSRVDAAYVEALAACRDHPLLSQKLRVVQDPRDPFHWFLHFKNLEVEPFALFTGGIYGHMQFCTVGRTDKKKNRRFLEQAPAFGILTPTGIFTSYQPDGSFGTGGKDIGIPGVCGTAHADEHIYRMSMSDTFERAPLQLGATCEWTTRSGVHAAVKVDEHFLEVESSGGEYGKYAIPILRYRGSIVPVLLQLLYMLDYDASPRGHMVASCFDGVARNPKEHTVRADALASESWARDAYNGQLAELFGSLAAAAPAPAQVPDDNPAAVPVAEDPELLPTENEEPMQAENAEPRPAEAVGPSVDAETGADETDAAEWRNNRIGELVGEPLPVPVATLLQGESAAGRADEEVELHTPLTGIVVKTEPVEDVRRGYGFQAPGVVLPVIAAASVQATTAAPRRRARTEVQAPGDDRRGEERPARRPRRVVSFSLVWDDGETVSCGQRVSRVFEHDEVDTVFSGAITDVQAEFRSCRVAFDDGNAHTVALSTLTRLL
tara:strand:+ start:1728 stop:3269 length:1542 start_codon:yes stop_codon:yes gene_type:complete